MILIGGHRPRTACASLIPSIDPGMLMSVNTILISSRLSRIRMASSAFDAQSGSNPASQIMSIASIRMSGSSSTASTIRRREVSKHIAFRAPCPKGRVFRAISSVLQRRRETFDPPWNDNPISFAPISWAICPQLDRTWNNMWPEQSRYVRLAWDGLRDDRVRR
jgi:hypothetical protein